MDLISNKIENEGPFDSIFAHSEGAGAALSTLMHRTISIKFLVLISPFPPFEANGRRRLDSSICGGPIVHIPSLVVHGEQDPFKPIVSLARSLLDPKQSSTFSWGGGHEIPNSGETALWQEVADEIGRLMKERRHH